VPSPKPFHPRRTFVLALVIIGLGVLMYVRDPAGPSHIHWTGRTMGTTYDIKIAHSPLSEVDARRLFLRIDQYLRQINDEMSTYIADSEISRFNRSSDVAPFPVSASFAEVTATSLEWATRSGGAFDPTLDPLINLWGFGHERMRAGHQPGDTEIEAALANVDHAGIQVTDAFHIQKSRPELQLNLNAIAKGYAVDGVAKIILAAGATNLYVEIGGDLLVNGVNPFNEPWRIGIEYPDPDAGPGERLHGVVHVSEGALAGSGDYRNFLLTDEGDLYAHILDPRTGRPTRHSLAAVNVYARTCMAADAVATAVIVMGAEEGVAWVDSLPDIEAIFFIRHPDGRDEVFFSSGFMTATGYSFL
jgi:thiamine biosynthesis lipoprotein